MTAPRRVLAFSWFYLPFVGGAELFLKALAEQLRGRYAFTIVTARMRRDLPRLEERTEGRIIRVGIGSALDKFLYLGLAPVRALRLERPDLVHAVMASGGAFAAAAYRTSVRRPALLTLQDGDSEAYVRSYLGPLFVFFAPLHRRFDRVHAISRFLAERAIGYGVPPSLVSVIPNGCDDALFERRPADAAVMELRRQLGLESERVIVSVSRLVLKNGIDRLIQALPLIVARCPRARLVLVGDGEDRPKLEALARQLGVAGGIHFVGSVPPARVPDYLSLGDVFVRPSLSEGLGTAFLEALACGVPIVASRIGGITDFLEEGVTGLSCDPQDPASIATATLRLLEDEELRRRLGTAGRRLAAERYRWSAVADRVAALYDELLSARGSFGSSRTA